MPSDRRSRLNLLFSRAIIEVTEDDRDCASGDIRGVRWNKSKLLGQTCPLKLREVSTYLLRGWTSRIGKTGTSPFKHEANVVHLRPDTGSARRACRPCRIPWRPEKKEFSPHAMLSLATCSGTWSLLWYRNGAGALVPNVGPQHRAIG